MARVTSRGSEGRDLTEVFGGEPPADGFPEAGPETPLAGRRRRAGGPRRAG